MIVATLGTRGYANDRLQSEILEREKSEQILRSIVEGTVSVTGKDFFRSLVRKKKTNLRQWEHKVMPESHCYSLPA
jgi:hypothetical protein